MSKDKLNWKAHAKIEKWDSEESYRRGDKPKETVEAPGNILLNEGITRLLNLLGGLGGTAFDNANAEIGVGDGTTATAATQADLQGASVLYAPMDTGYPSVANQTITFRATFQDADANFAWQEWSIRNGATAGENLNRKVVNLGTKTGGVWSLTATITVS